MKLILSILIMLLASISSGKELEFDFSNKSGSQTISFTNDFNVTISGVNEYDFEYKVSVDGVEAKNEEINPGGFGEWIKFAQNGDTSDSTQSGILQLENKTELVIAAKDSLQVAQKNLQKAKDRVTVAKKKMDNSNYNEAHSSKQEWLRALALLGGEIKKLDSAKDHLESVEKEFEKAQIQRLKPINDQFKSRMAIFAFDPWDKMTEHIFKNIQELNEKIMKPDSDPRQFSLEVSGLDLSKAAEKAGAGGVVVVTVSVEPMLSKIITKDGSFSVARKIGNFDDPKIKDHIETRTYRINFKPKKRIRTSIGPFIAGVKRTHYEKVLAPGGSTGGFVVAKTKEGDTASGATIAWNVDFYRPCSALAFGLQWGLAYSPQKQADESILGLMGLCIYPANQETVYISAGVAFGKETILTGGWKENDSIEPDQELPTSSRFIGRHYLGVAFNF